MASLAEMLMGYVMPPEGAEVVEGTRGGMLPVANYRLPDGRIVGGPAFPQPMMDAGNAMAYALGYTQDPNAPEGYVSQEALQRGGEGLAGSAAVGSIAARAPAGALRSGMARGSKYDDLTGLPLNDDGTVTLYHATKTPQAAESIRRSKLLKSKAEPDVYLSTAKEGTGYGDYVVAVKVDPKRLQLDDEFPDGRMDFRIYTGRPGGSAKIELAANRSQAAAPGQILAQKNAGQPQTVSAGALRSGLARELMDMKGKYHKLDKRRQELEFGPSRNQDDPALDAEFNRVERELNVLTGLADRKLKKVSDDEFENLFQQGLVPEMWANRAQAAAPGQILAQKNSRGPGQPPTVTDLGRALVEAEGRPRPPGSPPRVTDMARAEMAQRARDEADRQALIRYLQGGQ